jgi:hypothetical protein
VRSDAERVAEALEVLIEMQDLDARVLRSCG